MRKIFKLAGSELKKIFLRPTIFIMVFLLLITSFICLLTFTPTLNQDYTLDINGTTLDSVYQNYSVGNYDYSKTNMDAIVTAAYDKYVNLDTEQKTYSVLYGKYENCRNDFNNLTDLLSHYTNANDVNSAITNYKKSLQDLSTYLTSNFSSSKTFLVVEKDYEKAIKLLDSHLEHLANANYTTPQVAQIYSQLNQVLKSDNFYNQFLELISSIKKIENISTIKATLITDYYNVGLQSLSAIASEIDNFNTLYTSNEIAKFKTLINNYYSRALTIAENIESAYKKLISQNISDSVMSTYRGYEGFNSTNLDANLAINKYLVDNNLYAENYLDALTFSRNSGEKTNAYDYLSYALDILTILIIFFCVIICSKMIAGEQTNNTMKLLAIRPLSRNKILFGKLLATMMFALIFLSFSVVVNTIIGGCFFGFTSMQMIGVVNCSVFITSPIVFILIQLVSISYELCIYISICLLISVLFKSYTGATVSSFVICFASIILNIFAGSSAWYRFLPMSNFNLYKYFTGISVTTGITSMFTSPVLPDTNIWFSLVYGLAVILIFNLISFITFKKKDLA